MLFDSVDPEAGVLISWSVARVMVWKVNVELLEVRSRNLEGRRD